MLVKSLATVVFLIAGLWATFRPLHAVEQRVAGLARYDRVFILLATIGLVFILWSF